MPRAFSVLQQCWSGQISVKGEQLATMQYRGTRICEFCRVRKSMCKTLRESKISSTSWKCTEHPAKDCISVLVPGLEQKAKAATGGESRQTWIYYRKWITNWNFVSCHWVYLPSISGRNIIWTCVYFLLAFENNVFILFH